VTFYFVRSDFGGFYGCFPSKSANDWTCSIGKIKDVDEVSRELKPSDTDEVEGATSTSYFHLFIRARCFSSGIPVFGLHFVCDTSQKRERNSDCLRSVPPSRDTQLPDSLVSLSHASPHEIMANEVNMDCLCGGCPRGHFLFGCRHFRTYQ
jgi:hypothetical protein